ncbi:hypothetical protein [Jannaschia sp. LMIT008]|uniref:hypothetical protein n=1 Tax=Jannaschia maritima TaxID=3032585 RepID=UPI00281219E4|nr:hypothetical protein [Jannaschia sp. LMIT008]
MDTAIIDPDRLCELTCELGEGDTLDVLSMFLDEASATIDGISGALDDGAYDKATHFVRSGALNLGLSGLARQAAMAAREVDGDGRDAAGEALRWTLQETRLVIGERKARLDGSAVA